MIQRIFHPIGQGAFYSERHENFNIVYDCGNWKNTKLADRVVKQSFNTNETIDILFISHFDYDHVNKIETLKKHCKIIKYVILPLLHKEERYILTSFYKALDQRYLLPLINDPSKYFGKNTKVIYVKKTNDLKKETNKEPKFLESIGDEIESGTTITLHKLDWIFIPFNYNYKNRNADLIKCFNSECLDINKFKNDLNYAIVHRAKIKEIYNKISGDINQNSMLVYSGPLNKEYHKGLPYFQYKICNLKYKFCFDHNKVACIYTGDSDLNIIDIKTIFWTFWDKVGTIQIPHHGDLKTFNKEILEDDSFCCPISVGLKNSYGHPSSKVIADILSRGCCSILITEQLCSVFIEIIYKQTE